MITAISITNRWLVTPLGLESFGRIWYLFVSYQDLGFVKRALEGTILKATGLSLAFENPYRFAFLYHSCKLIILIGLIYRLLVKNQIENRALIYAIFFSPALVLHYGYETGSMDATLAILTLAIFSFNISNLLFIIALCTGVMLHEVYIFFIPSLVALRLNYTKEMPQSFVGLIWKLLIYSAAPTLIVAILIYAAQNPPDRLWYEEIISKYLGPAVNKHPFWSGYFELYKGIKENVDATHNSRNLSPTDIASTLIPLLYTSLLLRLIYLLYKRTHSSKAWILAICLCLPMIAFYFATDLYRYFSYIGTIAILGIISTWNDKMDISNEIKYLLIAITILTITGPLGNFPVSDPYPVLRFAADKIL